MKKIVGFLFLVAASVLLYACTGLTLEAPTVTLTGDTISWEAVPEATQYFVYVYETSSEPGTEYQTVTATSFDLTLLSLADGTYNVYVVASSGTSFSAQSNAIEYVVSGGSGLSLDAPTGVTLTGDTLSWNAVTDATGYTIVIGTTEVDTTNTSYDLSTVSLADGTYNVYVIATAGSTESTNSSTVSYTVSGSSVSVPTTPTNVSITGSVVSWDAVTGADSYIVTVNGTNITVTTTSYDLSSEGLIAGDYPVTVIAVNTAGQSSASTAVTYTAIGTSDVNAIIAGVLPIINPEYEANMTISDFDGDTGAYGQYMQIVGVVTIYANACVDVDLLTVNAIGIFADIAALIELEEPPFDNIETLIETTSVFEDNNVTPEVLAHIITAVGTEALAIGVNQLTSDLSSVQAELVSLQATLSSHLLGSDYVNLLAIIANNTPLEAAMITAKLANNDMYAMRLLEVFIAKAVDLANSQNNNNDYYYSYDLDDQDVDMMIAIAEEVASGADAAFINTANMYYGVIANLMYDLEHVQEVADHIQELTMIMDRLNGLDTLLNDSPETIESALSTVFEFMFTVRSSIPTNMIDILDAAIANEDGFGSLTTADIILLKNEFVNVISNALPSEETFQTFYESLLVIGEIALGNDVTDLTLHADYLGSVSYNMINLELMFIGSITATNVEEVQTLVTAMQTAYGENGNPMENPVPLIDMFDYVRTYLTDFATLHPTEIAALEALLGPDGVEALYMEVLAQLAAFATDQNPEELDQILYVINALEVEYDQYTSLMVVFKDLGMNLVNAFIDSDASILTQINAIMAAEDADVATIVSLLQGMIDEVSLYHGIAAAELTQANFENVLSLLVEVAVYQATFDPNYDLPYDAATFESNLRALIPHVSSLLVGFASLESDAFAELDALVISDYINLSYGYAEPVRLGSAKGFIDMLDALLTTENETLINNMINTIFTDILADPFIINSIPVEEWQSMFRNMLDDELITLTLPIDPLEINGYLTDVRALVQSKVDEFKMGAHAYALYDVTSLTPEQEEEIMMFATMYNTYLPVDESYHNLIDSAQALEVNVPTDDLYRTKPLVYSFTTNDPGYYTFTFTAEYEVEAWIEGYSPVDDQYMTIAQGSGTSYIFTGWIDAGVTYYAGVEIYDAIYLGLSVLVEPYTGYTDVTTDSSVNISTNEEMLVYRFIPITSGYYEFTLSTATYMSADVIVMNAEGNKLIDAYWLYLNAEERAYHFYAEAGMTYYIEIHSYGEAFDFIIEDYPAMGINLDTPETVNYSADTQYYVFEVDYGAYYNLSFSSTAGANFYLWFGSDENGAYQDSPYYVAPGETLLEQHFFLPGTLYILEVSSMVSGESFDILLAQTPTLTLVEDTPLDVYADGMMATIYSFTVDGGYYEFEFANANDVYIYNQIMRDDQMYWHEIDGMIMASQNYIDHLILAPGTYYVMFSTDSEQTVTVSLTEIAVQEMVVDQMYMIDVAAEETIMMSFSPTESGWYGVYSENDDEYNLPYVMMYNEWDDYPQFSTEYWYDMNFEFSNYLEVGNTYYFVFSNHESMPYDVGIEYTDYDDMFMH